MNNDLTWLHDTTLDCHLPVLVWHPQHAEKETYAELARRRPSMKPQIARACMHADYQVLFDELNPTPDVWLWLEAERCENTCYLGRIEHAASELGIDLDALCVTPTPHPDVTEKECWPMRILQQEMRPQDGSQSHTL
ncbi:uncharacterized protein N7482_003959 [Penicillium canariense]|uniref:Uncharacterized protein n=1 Tax=Penicillium canariense TaxID=189055 RepID=A0A9W9I878_9EURO|nr:uncharacterized protein N7482_003959 [Penicillium canariense]KAJ5168365.1 hypothetical protein N7482_003959 [Penicillium canariense]